MRTSITAIAGFLGLAVASPANPLFARHAECEFSATTGGVIAEGTCKLGKDAGECALKGYTGTYGCDYKWHNDAGTTPCEDAKDSKYACKKDGDPCWAYLYAEDKKQAIIHCSTK